jgi:hypothetical protein
VSLDQSDIKQINAHGLSMGQVEAQLELFRHGISYINLVNAATIGSGIISVSEEDKGKYLSLFDKKKDELDLLKFVPASGAATRMFKFLFQFLEDFNPNKETIYSYIDRNNLIELSTFLNGMEQLPFYNDTLLYVKSSIANFEDLSKSEKDLEIIKSILDEDRLRFGASPKGLLPFHRCDDRVISAFEEQLIEASLYVHSKDQINVHFTISELHDQKFINELNRIKEIVNQKTNSTINVSFSHQNHATDTIAVTVNNEPLRNSEGNLLFRPSGHGALLDNLNELDADIVFIKNIDNIAVPKYHKEIACQKMILAGILIEVRGLVFQYLKVLNDSVITDSEIEKIRDFLSSKLNVIIDDKFRQGTKAFQISYLKKHLNKPIRVCGMVKNEGEPGGGPFWVKDAEDKVSLQIVELAQIDKTNEGQLKIFDSATHFNPVDLVCSLKDHEGKVFDLSKFVDHNTAFISSKTFEGNEIKALELPGLWNGSMAHWNTIFVEVPLITFSPVKTVNDLLKPAHQA